MWLKYGVSQDNALVSIEDVPSGKTFLTCLYCGEGLTAKKGKVKEHHFAHTKRRVVLLPIVLLIGKSISTPL
jgi:hypothetical protein